MQRRKKLNSMRTYTLHVPTGDFAFIEQDYEAATPQEAVAQFRAIQRAYTGGFGLEAKEWNQCLDRYLNGKGMDSNTYASLSADQQRMIQELKKAYKRIKAKNTTDGAFYDADEGNGPGKGENGDWSGQD